MEKIEQKLLQLFENFKSEKTLEEIKKKLNLKGEEETKLLVDTLYNMQVEGILYLDNNRYSLLSDKNILQGQLLVAKNGHAYVKSNGTGIKLDNVSNCFIGDIVTVKDFHQNKDGKWYGSIDKIIKRSKTKIACIFKENKLYPYGLSNKNFIEVNDKFLTNLIENELVLFDLVEEKIVSSIGHKDDPDIDLKAIAVNNGFELDFSEKYLREIEKIKTNISANELINRVDLRGALTFTLDGKYTKDFDDAISLEKVEGGYKVFVHIADVSHYVKPFSNIYQYAMEQGTSCYMEHSVIVMLHRKLSNGICSLNPYSDRLTKTFEVTLDQDCKVTDFKVYRSIINSKKRMTYDEVNRILEGNYVDGYSGFLPTLFNLKNISNNLEKQKVDRGYLSLDIPEYRTMKYKQFINVTQNVQGEAEKIIENLMLLANQETATYLHWLDLSMIYRVHDLPNKDLLKSVIDKINSHTGKNINNIHTLIKELKKMDVDNVFFEILLRGLKKAYYDTVNIGHFALALEHYGQFTSPIRRAGDLLNHYVLDSVLNGNFELPFEYEEFKKLADNCSSRERAADKCEDEATKMRTAEYMTKKIGETFTGTIINVTENGLLVRTDNLFVGNITLSDIGKYCNYNGVDLFCGSKKFNIGDKISFVVKEASKENRTVYFMNPEHIVDKKLIKRKEMRL